MDFERPRIDLRNASSEFQSILDVVDFNASQNGDRIFCMQARKVGSPIEISHKTFKLAILACAESLKASFEDAKCSDSDQPVARREEEENAVALLMESDVSLLVHMFATMSLGRPVLLLSTRLSPSAIAHLVNATQAKTMITAPVLHDVAMQSLDLRDAADRPAIHQMQAFEVLLSIVAESTHVASSPKLRLPAHADVQRSLILHSSGTTGLPKPIAQPAHYLLGFVICHQLQESQVPAVCVSTLPLYHGFGLIAPCLSLGVGMSMCLPAPHTTSNCFAILDLIRETEATALISVPSILEDIAALADGIRDQLARLKFIAFGGGRLKESDGQRLSSCGGRLLNHYGATETGPLARIFVPEEDYDWHYFRLRSDTDLRLTNAGSDESGQEHFMLATRPLGWDRWFEIQDRLVRRPGTAQADFKVDSRTDDMIVLANGEKVHPAILEAAVSECPNVKVALAFGEGRSEIGIIVQPMQASAEFALPELLDDVWATVKQVNERMDAHAQIMFKVSILILPAGAKIARSDKGSILRREMYKLYDQEIRNVYRRLEQASLEDTGRIMDVANLESEIQALIAENIKLPVPKESWTTEDDLFELGLDSLQAIKLRRLLLSSFRTKEGKKLPPDSIHPGFIYRHNSVKKMTTALQTMDLDVQSEELSQAVVDNLVARYGVPAQTHALGTTVLLLGATGGLGAHILAELAEAPGVSAVICLNRPNWWIGPLARQRAALTNQKIELSLGAWQKVQVFEYDPVATRLGLDRAAYEHIQATVTHVLHAAWPMSFQMHLSSFQASFQTLRSLLVLTRESRAGSCHVLPRVTFISSVSTVANYAAMVGEAIVPECPMPSPSCALNLGYAGAKLVCEKMIEKAATDLAGEVQVSYIRIGQLSGSSKSGIWNQSEHIPALFRASQLAGALPRLGGTLSWIPVDTAAEVVCDILLGESPSLCFQVENPVRQSWRDVMTLFGQSVGMTDKDEMSLQQWTDRVRDRLSEEAQILDLLPFFESDFERMACGKVVMGTDGSRHVSKALRALGCVSDEVILRYVSRWRATGFLQE